MLCCAVWGVVFFPPLLIQTVNHSVKQRSITVQFFCPLPSAYYHKHEINNDFRLSSRAKYSFVPGKAQQGHEIPHSSELK